MNEDFVTYEIAKKLKEKGFDWEKIATYNPRTKVRNNHLEPTISQALKWLREEKKLHIVMDITKAYPSCNILYWGFIVFDVLNGDIIYFEHNRDFYEQAALAGIEYVLDNIIKEEQP